GDPWKAAAACQAQGAGRNPAPGSTDSAGNPIAPNTPGQSYNTCVVQSSRVIIIHANGSNVSQEALLNQALNPAVPPGSPPGTPAPPPMATLEPIGSPNVNGNNVTAANQMFFSGGTTPQNRQRLLAANGVPSSLTP